MHHTHAKSGIKRLAPALLGAAAMLLTPLVTHAAADVAKMTSHGSAISWHPSGAYDGASLTVSGPGGTESYTFAAHDQISITAPANDGSYTYQLVLRPMVPPGLKKQMKKHRKQHPGGGKLVGAMQGGKKSGAFSVAGGTIVDSAEAE